MPALSVRGQHGGPQDGVSLAHSVEQPPGVGEVGQARVAEHQRGRHEEVTLGPDLEGQHVGGGGERRRAGERAGAEDRWEGEVVGRHTPREHVAEGAQRVRRAAERASEVTRGALREASVAGRGGGGMPSGCAMLPGAGGWVSVSPVWLGWGNVGHVGTGVSLLPLPWSMGISAHVRLVNRKCGHQAMENLY